ncbi:hypothetical protein CHLRE_06g254250v5 [Chlamydomonas reinhardtii]|uniref:Uncharacterized protein n=1 Tax=Chlamydomonas reinhardtii TaxID=3055 RepID=A0A2K3DM77_CHLRE|nr:uncharacterized protein CHLRE_06g254250v5 [Chlamydomonas reinhardtii]PNW81644.1 hypothetical protein CHLRE_06g254250v5 [Chlamydomonas reinhardtii]
MPVPGLLLPPGDSAGGSSNPLSVRSELECAAACMVAQRCVFFSYLPGYPSSTGSSSSGNLINACFLLQEPWSTAAGATVPQRPDSSSSSSGSSTSGSNAYSYTTADRVCFRSGAAFMGDVITVADIAAVAASASNASSSSNSSTDAAASGTGSSSTAAGASLAPVTATSPMFGFPAPTPVPGLDPPAPRAAPWRLSPGVPPQESGYGGYGGGGVYGSYGGYGGYGGTTVTEYGEQHLAFSLRCALDSALPALSSVSLVLDAAGYIADVGTSCGGGIASGSGGGSSSVSSNSTTVDDLEPAPSTDMLKSAEQRAVLPPLPAVTASTYRESCGPLGAVVGISGTFDAAGICTAVLSCASGATIPLLPSSSAGDGSSADAAAGDGRNLPRPCAAVGGAFAFSCPSGMVAYGLQGTFASAYGASSAVSLATLQLLCATAPALPTAQQAAPPAAALPPRPPVPLPALPLPAPAGGNGSASSGRRHSGKRSSPEKKSVPGKMLNFP